MMTELGDYKKVTKLRDLYRELDYYGEQFDRVKKEIQALAVTMSVRDIKYAINESEKI